MASCSIEAAALRLRASVSSDVEAAAAAYAAASGAPVGDAQAVMWLEALRLCRSRLEDAA